MVNTTDLNIRLQHNAQLKHGNLGKQKIRPRKNAWMQLENDGICGYVCKHAFVKGMEQIRLEKGCLVSVR